MTSFEALPSSLTPAQYDELMMTYRKSIQDWTFTSAGVPATIPAVDVNLVWDMSTRTVFFNEPTQTLHIPTLFQTVNSAPTYIGYASVQVGELDENAGLDMLVYLQGAPDAVFLFSATSKDITITTAAK